MVEKLTERENEVISLMAQGYSNCAISAKLFISITTLKTHIEHIYNKLEIFSQGLKGDSSTRVRAVLKYQELLKNSEILKGQNMLSEIINDQKILEKLEKEAYRLQQRFDKKASEMNKEYKNWVFKCPAEQSEWAFYHCNGFNHSFSFEFFRISKKNPDLTVQESKYISLRDFRLMAPTGRKLPESKSNFKQKV